MLDRSLNMMRNSKCLCCIPIETGCFIFGIFSAVMSGLGVLSLSMARVWMTLVTGDDTFERYSRDPNAMDEMLMSDETLQQRTMTLNTLMTTLAAVLFLYIWCLSSFIFSVFLCYGTHKKRPGFVKAYLIYGVVVTVLMMIGAILYSWLMADIVGGSLVLIACGIYSMLLLMVQRTHELISAAQARDAALLLPGPGPCLKN